MKRTIIPGARTGRVRIPASKSQAHRLLICAALGEEKTEVVCDGISADIAATAKCLSALGAKIEEMETGFLVSPIKKVPEGRCDLYCGESGSTLRFLLPIVGALGAPAAAAAGRRASATRRPWRAGGIPPRGAAAPAPARPAG